MLGGPLFSILPSLTFLSQTTRFRNVDAPPRAVIAEAIAWQITRRFDTENDDVVAHVNGPPAADGR
jgi:hypothetical protein